ncbi:hypothetical protein ALC62_03876 [Cyphomyrmex costatus]|uniref:DDE-1 domain-containing protein n=1 Tax=Cyphomyrmex costatus TaxID=456900 RepID=A0A151IKU0_9HYME|nr:hypothetical protein ALC62_03876 [Cyphomyrmex costatus]
MPIRSRFTPSVLALSVGGLTQQAALTQAQARNFIPPFFIFPRKKFKSHFLSNAPIGSAGSANKSDWITAPDFLLFLQHFQSHSRASAENPVLLILDNHQSHTSIEALQFYREHNITVLSLPPHCSHKLQSVNLYKRGPPSDDLDLDICCQGHDPE